MGPIEAANPSAPNSRPCGRHGIRFGFPRRPRSDNIGVRRRDRIGGCAVTGHGSDSPAPIAGATSRRRPSATRGHARAADGPRAASAGSPTCGPQDDLYLSNRDDWAFARRLDEDFDRLDFRGLLERYFDLAPEIPADLRRRQVAHILTAPERARRWLEALGPIGDRPAARPGLRHRLVPGGRRAARSGRRGGSTSRCAGCSSRGSGSTRRGCRTSGSPAAAPSACRSATGASAGSWRATSSSTSPTRARRSPRRTACSRRGAGCSSPRPTGSASPPSRTSRSGASATCPGAGWPPTSGSSAASTSARSVRWATANGRACCAGARSAGGTIRAPGLPEADLAHFGPIKRRVARLYNALIATRAGQAAARRVGPLFHVVCERPADEAGPRSSHPSHSPTLHADSSPRVIGSASTNRPRCRRRREDDRRQPRRLHAEDRRPGEEARQARPARPRPGAEPAVLVAEPQAVADRLARRVAADVPGTGRRHHDDPPPCPASAAATSVSWISGRSRTSPRRRRDGRRSCSPPAAWRAAGASPAAAARNGAYSQKKTAQSIEPRRPWRARPGPSPPGRRGSSNAATHAAAQPGPKRHESSVKATSGAVARSSPSRRSRGTPVPGAATTQRTPGRPVARRRRRDPVAGRRDDDLDPPAPALAGQRGERPRHRPGRIAGRDDHAQRRAAAAVRPIQPSPGSRPARTGSRSSRRTPRP